MSSQYNKDQRKANLFQAIKMRDAKVERANHKTGVVEVLRYCRDYIKKVCNIRAYEAVHINVYKKPMSRMEADKLRHMQKVHFTNAKREARGKKPLPMKPLKHAV